MLLAPSYTNPSMWRRVPGSAFFTAELCNPVTISKPCRRSVAASKTLTGFVSGIQAAKNGGNDPAACSLISSFVTEMRAESGKQITGAQAARATAEANRVAVITGC